MERLRIRQRHDDRMWLPKVMLCLIFEHIRSTECSQNIENFRREVKITEKSDSKSSEEKKPSEPGF